MPCTSIGSSIRTITAPSDWPSPPALMSFSTLLELEACPKRWALNAAKYPDIWQGAGYPKMPSLAALKGSIVHNVISLIARGLSQQPKEGIPRTHVSQVLRNLGGFTLLIENTIEEVLQQYSDNPRALPNIKRISDQLKAEIPELRLKSQALLARVNFDRYDSLGICWDHVSQLGTRHSLPAGIYSELEVKSTDLGWHGFIDFFSLSDDACEIRDFKSGTQKEEHILQLNAYALLWLKDRELNPNGRTVTRLMVSYLKDDVELSIPKPSDYPIIEINIRERTAQALLSIRSMPPKAIVGAENCCFCQVRHLCNEYWDIQRRSVPKLPVRKEFQFIDMQIIAISRRGPASWDAKVESSYFALEGKPVLVIDQVGFLIDLKEGKRIRLLNVYAAAEGDEPESVLQPLTVGFGNSSEYFVLP